MSISHLAHVETKTIGKNVTIHPFAVIYEGAVLGDNVVIHPHAVISSGVEIGDNTEVFSSAFIGKEPKGAGTTARQPVFEKYIKIGANCSIGPNATIYYDVSIGNNCLIGDNSSIREKVVIGAFSIVGRNTMINYNAVVGTRTKIMDSVCITGNAYVGNNVFIGAAVVMANDNKLGACAYNQEEMHGPTILDHAKIGIGAIILPAIRIGENAIVAAGAVVTKDVADKTLVTGIPARFAKDVKHSMET